MAGLVLRRCRALPQMDVQGGVWLKPVYIVGGIVVVAAVVLGGVAFANTLTPYVSIAEARAAARTVQVHGYLEETLGYDAEGHFRFAIVDDHGDVLTIVYEQPRPANFEQANGFVAIGRYDPQQDVFRASKLLVKCPSKYQEQGEQYQRQPTETTP
jgi:cytochrome c-type biogenesis protein CcmE